MISFDIDGVLANFVRGFTRVAHDLYGTPVCDSTAQATWFIDEFAQVCLTAEQCNFEDGPIWHAIKASTDFWSELDPLNPSVMSRINRLPHKIFVTNRYGRNVLRQTHWWLSLKGIIDPQVIVTADKAAAMKAYRVVAHIDDAVSNCESLRTIVPYVAMLHMPYNLDYHLTWKAKGGEIVLSVDHFLDECERLHYV